MSPIHSNGMQGGSALPAACHARRQRTNRIRLAWGTSLVSTITTVAVQLLVIPLVYRSLGQSGYAAYAAITAAAGLIAVLNLGIGGSLVTPMTAAVAAGNTAGQATLVYAGLLPLLVLCLFAAAVVLPVVSLLPLTLFLGRLGATQSVAGLRAACLIAASAALIALPLSATDVLRQAFQEMHISNLFGAAANVVMFVALLLVAHHSHALALFVAAFVLPPLLVRVGNNLAFFAARPYLLRRRGRFPWLESRALLGDGLRYLSSSFSYVLVYQWPVYWIARTLPPRESVPFAISMQLVLLAVSFTLGFLRPLWSSTADAHLRGDRVWLEEQIRTGRRNIVLAGACVLLIMLVAGQPLVRLWIRQPIALDWQVRGLIGVLILLAIWEQFHFLLALGVGRLQQATAAIFQRALCCALLVPILTTFGPRALWCGLCASILFWTAWRLPGLLRAELTAAGARTEPDLA